MSKNTSYINNTYARPAHDRLLSPATVTEIFANMTESAIVKQIGSFEMQTHYVASQAKEGIWDTMQLKDFLILEVVAMQELHSKAALAEFINR